MSANLVRILGAAVLYLLSFVTGFWLSRAGKPYNGILLTLHKLISLAAVAFLVIAIVRINQVVRLGAMELAAAVVTGLFFLGTIVSGGLLSTGNPTPAAILTMHQITPFLTVLSTAATFCLLLNGPA